MIRIVVDSTCDLPKEVIEQYGITAMPAYINVGTESYRDGIDMTRQTFYEQLPSFPTPPTTAAPASGLFTEAYEALADEGATEILSIHVAASLSGMVNSAHVGAQATDKVKVTVFDSQQLTIGHGLLALTAAQAVEAGKSMDEIVALLAERIKRTHVFAILDTLEFLRRSGRVSWAAFGFGSLLKIKPVLSVYEGQPESIARIRTMKRAVQHVIGLVTDLAPLEQIAVLHTNNPAGAEKLKQQITDLIPAGTSALIVDVTPAIGVHVGPGAVGLACITAK